MTVTQDTGDHTSGRLSTVQAALVIARRDFVAILFSRAFFFFLLGPLFPVIVGIAASSVGSRVEQKISVATLGVAMSPAEADALIAADKTLAPSLGGAAPDMLLVRKLGPDERTDPAMLLKDQHGAVSAIVSGSLSHPVLTGTSDQIDAWSGPVSLIAAQALNRGPRDVPGVALAPVRTTDASDRQGRMHTAQAGQMLLFLLTMLLAGMVLSNLVEEKANKIIEVLAAAIPMEAVFYGKLFAMLAVSFVGIAVWGASFGGLALAGGHSLGEFVTPAVGWPMFFVLGTGYFAMAYLLLGSVFLTIGSMATTVREVQTLSMPASMSQLMVFFFATYATASPGSSLELVAEAIPFCSPFAMMSRAAQETSLTPHLLALAWQALWVALFVHYRARLFRHRVLKSGPQRVKARKPKLLRA